MFLQIKDPELEQDYKGKKPMIPMGDGLPKHPREPPRVWTRPEEGWHKLNVDASYLHDENTGSWGAVLRDYEGKVVMSAWGTIPCCQSAKTAEAIAVREGMKSIIPMATNPVIVESDNSTVVNELKSAMTSRSQFFVILSESRDLLIHLPDYKV
jgi:hypothetical protein